MKKILLFLFLLLSPILFPREVLAQTCTSQDATCQFTGACVYGSALFSTDCTTWGYRCCPNAPAPGATCTSLGGTCQFTGGCVNGGALNSSDCTTIGFLCCPNPAPAGTLCTDLGGACQFTASCVNGSPLNSSDCTGIGYHCCHASITDNGPAVITCHGVEGFQTAIGCIPVATSQAFITFFLRWGMGIAGGIALALIGYSGFMITTSMGNPQRLQAGKETLTAAVMGLVLLLFGVFLLRLIGVEILKIPGFGG